MSAQLLKDTNLKMYSSSATVPPFYWKVPAPEKDYMGDNVRRLRQLNSQVKNKKTEGLKAVFIPGVTKNPKYEHVPSRLSGILKGEVRFEPRVDTSLSKSKSQASASASATTSNYPRRISSKLTNDRTSDKQPISKEVSKPIWGASLAANARRLSKSTTDLSLRQKSSAPPRSLRRRQQPLLAQHESVYNWRFSDNNNLSQTTEDVRKGQPQKFEKFSDANSHRVEYLPCDGICAEETFLQDEGKGDSGRSTNSSARTSRGVNTEETRIFQDASFKKPVIKPIIKSTHTQNNGLNSGRFMEGEDVPANYHWNGDGDSTDMRHLQKSFSDFNIKDKGGIPIGANSNSKAVDGVQSHTVGTIPKYLKQRQQEWKEEAEAKKLAERNKDIPPGQVLMSDNERIETLRTLQANYDTLVAELNRIPIRIDTIRVRDQKIRLEDQLTKLEQAMRIFSRPRVFVDINH